MKASIFSSENGYYIHFHLLGSSQIWKMSLAECEMELRERGYERDRLTRKWPNALGTYNNDPFFVARVRARKDGKKKRKGKIR